MEEAEFYLEDLRSKFNKINPNEYYLSYSGGRDSELLRVIIKDYLKLNIPIISVNTRMEFPEILKRIIKNSDDILIPKVTIFEVKEKYGIPLQNKETDGVIYYYQSGSRADSVMKYFIRTDQYKIPEYIQELLKNNLLHKVSPYCCRETKKKPAHEFENNNNLKPILAITGIGSEGTLRHNNYSSCFTKSGKFTPLHDAKKDIIRKIESYLNVEIPQIYKTCDRTGCVGCPYGKHPIEELLHPSITQNRYNYIYECFHESYEVKRKINTKLL